MKEIRTEHQDRNDHEVSIFAGNSRVSVTSDGNILVQPQLMAFRAALQRANELYHSDFDHPPIFIAFDHKGIFKKQFLVNGLSNSQKRRPKLSQLRKEIVEVYAPIALELGISLEKITAIHEDSARSHANYIIERGNVPEHLLQWMRTLPNEGKENTEDGVQSKDGKKTNQITCAAVTSEYFSSSTTENSRILEVFIEDDPWSRVDVYVRGARLMRKLGNDILIRLRLINKDGSEDLSRLKE